MIKVNNIEQTALSALKVAPANWQAVEKVDPDPSEGTHFIVSDRGALGYWRGHKHHHDDSQWVMDGEVARHIAAANPAAVLELVRLLRARTAARDYLRSQVDERGSTITKLASELAEVKAENAKLLELNRELVLRLVRESN